MNKSDLGFSTKAVHIGSEPEPVTGAVMPSISLSTTYKQVAPGQHAGYEYSRTASPTRDRLQKCLASLEGAKHAIVTATGMSALDLILKLVPAQKQVLYSKDAYGGTWRLINKVYQDHFHFTETRFDDLQQTQAKISEIKPYLVLAESPTNPTLRLCDIAQLAKTCKENNSLLCIDSTFAGPYLQNPLKLGADIVWHSMTKSINGHSDSLGGCIMLNNDELAERLKFNQNTCGPSLSNFDSWLILRGVKTLSLRVARSSSSALAVAKYLMAHPKVQSVNYPGLESNPQHNLAVTQSTGRGFGGLLSFRIKGGKTAANSFLSSLKVFTLAESLGGVESLAELPAVMTHATVPQNEREELGIFDDLIRLSVGIEEEVDLLADLEQAFSHS